MSGIRCFQTMIYKMGDSYKIVYLKRFIADEYHIGKDFDKNEKIGDKFENNISRAKSRIFQLALCNKWDLFATFTLHPEKYDRTDLPNFKKKFTQWIRDERKKTNEEWGYILIPEWHDRTEKNGLRAWHMHGLISGVDWSRLYEFKRELGHPYDLYHYGYRYHMKILDKFGFNSFGTVRNSDAAARYITKYITKEMAEINIGLGNHLFLTSNGLAEPEKLAEGYLIDIDTQKQFENDYLISDWISESDYLRIRRRMY